MKIEDPEKFYRSSSHVTFSCQYHIIFCPKYRRRVFGDPSISNRLKEIFSKEINKVNGKIIEMEIMEDHVHLLLDIDPVVGVMKTVRKLKGVSSKKMRDEFKKLKSRIPSLWTRSFFVSTVGTMTLDVVKKYIENQKNV